MSLQDTNHVARKKFFVPDGCQRLLIVQQHQCPSLLEHQTKRTTQVVPNPMLKAIIDGTKASKTTKFVIDQLATVRKEPCLLDVRTFAGLLVE
jgi:hypothetical protein